MKGFNGLSPYAMGPNKKGPPGQGGPWSNSKQQLSRLLAIPELTGIRQRQCQNTESTAQTPGLYPGQTSY